MAEPARAALVVHFHQPVDNLERVVRRAAARCYLPFLETIGRHPEVPFTLHYSGCLLDWLDRVAPEVVRRLEERVAGGQVELLTGGVEEPILAAIPERDRIAQIERMSERLRSRFGSSPRGLWLTERVWEPELAGSLARAGVEYTVVDDTSLLAVGVEAARAGGPFVTDHEGRPVRLLGASRELRYLIPYARPAAVLRRLQDSSGLSVYADDGEKFGEWPGTARQVYRRGWLDRFLDGLTAAQREQRLRLVRLGEAAGAPPVPVQLPSGSYDEMMTWALPTEARRRLEVARAGLATSDPLRLSPFVRGAPWRGFLAKYPEARRLHQAMLRASAVVAAAGGPREALEELHRGQCNCGYWHGTFGGAYLPFLRLGLWHHLVRAELLARGGAPSLPPVEVGDWDADGQEEIRLAGPWGYAVVDPGAGGQVVELVSWEGESNLVAVMGRHLEPYHLEARGEVAPVAGMELAPLTAPLVPSEGLEFDVGEIGALRDGVGGEWWDQPYSHRLEGEAVVLTASRAGAALTKRISATEWGLRVDYRLVAEPRARGPLLVEVRSCPWAPGAEVGPVAVNRRSHRAVVRLPGALAALRLEAPSASSIEWTRLVAVGATLNGVETLVQGVSVLISQEISGSGAADLRIELAPEPAARPPGG